MAMIEEAIEITEAAEEGIGEEAETASEELDSEEAEELEEEANAARENVSRLRSVIDFFRSIEIPGPLKTFIKFVGKNVAIGAILFGVNFLLSAMAKQKKTSGPAREAAQTKYKKIKALSTLISDMSKTSKTAVDWLQAHEKDTIDLAGIKVPLIDIFTKYTGPMGDSVDKAFEVAKTLQTKKDSNDKTTFNVPTTGQVDTIVDSVKDFIAALDGFVKFAGEKESDFPTLKTLTVTSSDIAKLQTDLDGVTSLPYC